MATLSYDHSIQNTILCYDAMARRHHADSNSLSSCVHSNSKCTKSIFGRDSDPDHAYDAPRTPSRLGEGYPTPFPPTPSVPRLTVSRISILDLWSPLFEVQ